MYVVNPKKDTDKFLEPIITFSKIVGYKSIFKKSNYISIYWQHKIRK